MKVLVISNDSSGLYMFRHEVMDEIVKIAELYICVPEGRFIDYWKSIGCSIIPYSFDRHGKNPLRELQQISFYKKTIDDIKPDICCTYTIKPNIYGGIACASRGVPYIANITGLGSAVECEGVFQKVLLRLYSYGLRKATKVFFQNEDNMNYMLNHKVVKGAYDLLPGSGVNLTQYQPGAYPKDGVIRFGFVSRIMKEKGIDQYLTAAKEIKKRYPYTEFHVFGSYEEDYEEKITDSQNSGIIIYHGVVSNMEKVYNMLSCVVHPTYYAEGMSNVLLESCACGRPIITTDRAGCREIVDDGINGFVVKQKDSNDLIKKIERFLSISWEEQRNFGINGRKKVEKEFDRRIIIQKYMNEIRKVANS